MTTFPATSEISETTRTSGQVRTTLTALFDALRERLVDGSQPIVTSEATIGSYTLGDETWEKILNVLPRGHLFGLRIGNNSSDPTNDIDIVAGQAAADTAPYAIMTLSSTLTKRLDAAWSVGSGFGGLDTGSIANTTYHVWLIQRSDTDVVDVLFSTSASSPTMPANYDRKRRIGSIVREAGAIVRFRQFGDFFERATVQDYAGTDPGTGQTNLALRVPTGLKLEAIYSVFLYDTSPTAINLMLSDPDNVGTSPSSSAFHLRLVAANGYQAAQVRHMTDASGQIRRSLDVSQATTQLWLNTHGWVDTRGRLS